MPPDILDNLTRVADAPPALSATSDVPTVETEAPPAPEPPPAEPPATEQAAEPGRADGAGPEAEAPAEPETPPARPRKTVQERFSDLTRERNEARERERKAIDIVNGMSAKFDKIDVLIEQLGRGLKPTETAPPVEARPTRDAFSAPDDYDAALVEWAGRKAARETMAEFETRRAEEQRQAEEKRTQDAQAQTFEQTVTAWNERRAAAMEKYPDFAEVAEGEVPITLPMRDAIIAD
jgi:hypothetical protein